MKTIDLGNKPSESGMTEAAPSGPAQDKKPKVYYPSFYLHDYKGKAADFPEAGSEGTATIKFKVASKTETDRDNGDGSKKSCSVELEVMQITFGEDSESDAIEEGLQEAETVEEDSTETEEE
ncbi:MAG: hypothetical protein M0Q93_00875 [Terrimicrobiaceae bacterium]|nr:hypothetical protein [Terrimicrobiaceae bacterium]